MERLSNASLSKLMPSIKAPRYIDTKITAGIVHFGVGNFHRAHQAAYCDSLLNEGETKWGIIGVSLRSRSMRDKLAPQNFLYTLATLGNQSLGESTSYRVIGSIQDVLVASENHQAVIDTVALDQTQVVTTTITEKGYCLANGEINLDHPDVIHDLKSLQAPRSIYGYLCAALTQREALHGKPLTILCCDNLHAGGHQLQQGVHLMLKNHSPGTLTWLDENVIFSSSMVDRVTPVTSETFKEVATEQLGLIDSAPVATEPFTQWVIDGKFAGQRPPFDRVGALFVDDIVPFERIKLRFLNAGHSMLAALGYLAGDLFVHEALQRPALASFTERTLKQNVLAVTLVPEGFCAEAYIDQVLDRFRNNNLPYAVLQVGTDSSQKIQQRWLPSIDAALTQGGDVLYLTFALAAWVQFIRTALTNNDLNDPLIDAFAACKPTSDTSDVHAFLAIAGAKQFTFFSNDDFMKKVETYHQAITELGVEQAIASIQFVE